MMQSKSTTVPASAQEHANIGRLPRALACVLSTTFGPSPPILQAINPSQPIWIQTLRSRRTKYHPVNDTRLEPCKMASGKQAVYQRRPEGSVLQKPASWTATSSPQAPCSFKACPIRSSPSRGVQVETCWNEEVADGVVMFWIQEAENDGRERPFRGKARKEQKILEADRRSNRFIPFSIAHCSRASSQARLHGSWQIIDEWGPMAKGSRSTRFRANFQIPICCPG